MEIAFDFASDMGCETIIEYFPAAKRTRWWNCAVLAFLSEVHASEIVLIQYFLGVNIFFIPLSYSLGCAFVIIHCQSPIFAIVLDVPIS